MEKIPKKYYCEKCDYKCCNKKDYNKHLLTLKHKNGNHGNAKNPLSIMLTCDLCSKQFKTNSGLWKHRQKSHFVEEKSPEHNSNKNDIFDENKELRELLLLQNERFQNQLQYQQNQMKQQQEQHHKEIKELIPQLQQITTINNNQKNCNNKFNLNFFLNEQCKDAMSIQNFIQNLNIGIKELEHMGDVGYVNGMMNIFTSTLGAMDIYKRPLHCTDLKRETLYIKHGDTWQKDTEDKSELKKLIKSVERKNYGTLRQWEKQHPDAFECDTPDNIEYMKISTESLGGEQSTDALKLNKIMKHVIREVYVK